MNIFNNNLTYKEEVEYYYFKRKKEKRDKGKNIERIKKFILNEWI